MQSRELGRSGLKTAPLAFGGNVFGWTADEAHSFSLLDAFVAGGGNFIDTADFYGGFGGSEALLGELVKGRRDRMVKRRGYRVELGEIEAGLYRHAKSREAAVKRPRVVRSIMCGWVRSGLPACGAKKTPCQHPCAVRHGEGVGTEPECHLSGLSTNQRPRAGLKAHGP